MKNYIYGGRIYDSLIIRLGKNIIVDEYTYFDPQSDDDLGALYLLLQKKKVCANLVIVGFYDDKPDYEYRPLNRGRYFKAFFTDWRDKKALFDFFKNNIEFKEV